MILSEQTEHAATLSPSITNTSQFSIKTSAKACSILSNNLYANKIRAIIRELCCNAIDSHVAAGKSDVPYEVTLPTVLDPYFAVKDYGTGLAHQQVMNLYTTYFESTKTESNDFIGALGLGSKSPFSYTNNFSVTSVYEGTKGLYSAYIDDFGIPSIALLTSCPTDEPNGVEVRFAVNDTKDFFKFRQEATHLFKHFSQIPSINQSSGFVFEPQQYLMRDLMEGIHWISTSTSIAVMGNVAYPIDVPNAATVLGEGLYSLLQCGLQIDFNLGEIQFQPSREGLSYTTSTINSIRAKLQKLSVNLIIKLTSDIDAVPNVWDKTALLIQRFRTKLWKATVLQYVADTKYEFAVLSPHGLLRPRSVDFTTEALAKQWNISITAFTKSHRDSGTKAIAPSSRVESTTPTQIRTFWPVPLATELWFIVNDTKTGALAKAKQHWKNNPPATTITTYVISPAVSGTPMNTAAFFDAIFSPPNVILASTLPKIERSKPVTTTAPKKLSCSVLALIKSHSYSFASDWSWDNKLSELDLIDDPTKTFYYVPIVGYRIEGNSRYTDLKDYMSDLDKIGLKFGYGTRVYGVRGDKNLDIVKSRPNWVELDTHVKDTFFNMSEHNVAVLAYHELVRTYKKHSLTIPKKWIQSQNPTIRDSVLVKLLARFEDMPEVNNFTLHKTQQIERSLTAMIGISHNLPYAGKVRRVTNAVEKMFKQYPLLIHLENYQDCENIIDYISMVDAKQHIEDNTTSPTKQ